MFALTLIVNFIFTAWLYPELFVNVDLRMVQGHETCGPMQYVFYLVGQFFQGGIQLFNRYDLFNTSFTQLSVGLYTPINFLVALGYVICSPFVTDQAKFYHHWYVVAYFGAGLLLRTFGTYLLARYMTKSGVCALLTTVVVNCFCAIAHMHLGGMCISSVNNHLPLLLFCFVYYWETRKFKAILAAVMVFLLASVNSLYVGFGYFYQVVHLFLFDMFIIWLVFQRGRTPLLKDKWHWPQTGMVAFTALLMMLPVLWWGLNVVHDFEMTSSGLGGTPGRFQRIFNPAAMMHDPLRYFIDSREVFHHAYDYTVSGWYISGAFLGITTMVLALIGIVLANHNYKLIFVTAAVFMGFLNVPSTKGGWMMWAHWIDTVTNPFCFLVRSFHYSVLLWYLTLAIPVCLGIKSLSDMVMARFEGIYAARIIGLKVIFAVGTLAAFFIPQPAIRWYALPVLALFAIFFFLFDGHLLKKNQRYAAALALFTLIACIEFHILKTYINTPSVDMNPAYWDGLRVKPRVHSAMYSAPIPTVMDYQNPTILPLRYFYRQDKQVVFPLISEFQGTFGDFYRYVPLALRLERSECMYVPRLRVFKGIDKDTQAQEYIKRDGRLMYFADAGIVPDKGAYAKVLERGQDRQVVQVEEAYTRQLKVLDSLKLSPPSFQQWRQQEYLFAPAAAGLKQLKEGVQYQWQLPDGFPSWTSSAVFTPDVGLMRVTIADIKLEAAQGALVTPWTFDVNNIRRGYLTLLLPKGGQLKDQRVSLTVLSPAEIIDVWRNTQDQLGITYRTFKDGWWVMHMPWDPKWEFYVDGVKTPLAKINRYFIGAPLTKGDHQLFLSYWPHSPLRWLIIVYVMAALWMMAVVTRWTWRWSRE